MEGRGARERCRTKNPSCWSPPGSLSESQPRLVTAFEALLNTSSGHVSKQFRTRVRALAVELGIDGVSGRLLDRMYDFRSKAYHGDEIYLFSGDPNNQPEIAEQHRRTVGEAGLLQWVLRGAVRKAIEHDDFRAVFEDDDRVRQRWPVRVSEPTEYRATNAPVGTATTANTCSSRCVSTTIT
jgi:hypothetical protein